MTGMRLPGVDGPRRIEVEGQEVGTVLFHRHFLPFDKSQFYYRIYPSSLAMVLREKEKGFMQTVDQRGLYGKYDIRKTDGTKMDPNAKYFILRLDTDEYARLALSYYAGLIKIQNHQLSADLLLLISTLERRA